MTASLIFFHPACTTRKSGARSGSRYGQAVFAGVLNRPWPQSRSPSIAVVHYVQEDGNQSFLWLLPVLLGQEPGCLEQCQSD